MVMKEAAPDAIRAILEEAKAVDVAVVDVSASTIADWFVVATGEAGKHLESMADRIRLAYKGAARSAIEGDGRSGWVCIDLSRVVVHLMSREARARYSLEDLWKETRGAREGAPKA